MIALRSNDSIYLSEQTYHSQILFEVSNIINTRKIKTETDIDHEIIN